MIKAVGKLRGILLDSREFEFMTSDGFYLHGNICKDVNETTLLSYLEQFFDKECNLHFRYQDSNIELCKILPL